MAHVARTIDSKTVTKSLQAGLYVLALFAFCFSWALAPASAQTVLVGDATIESKIDTNPVGVAETFQATAAASGTVGSINVFLDPSSTSTKIYIGIYSDNSGQPGTLLTQGSSSTLYAGTWNTVSVSTVSVTSGNPYWIAILGTAGGAPVFRDRTISGTGSHTSSQTNLTSLPSAFSTGKTWSTNYLSAYAESNTYPAAVLLGNQAVETYLDKNPAGRGEAFPVTANTTGTVGTIALYFDPTSGSGPIYTGLYSDNGGKPGTLLGQGSTSHPVAGSWNQISITNSNITAGSKYWIAVLGATATSPYFRDRQTTICESQTTTQTNLTSLPSSWATGATWQTCYISAYALPSAGSPVLSVTPSTLSFSAVQSGANPSSQNLNLSNTGTGTLSFTVSTDQSWLTATPSSGTAPQTVAVSAAVSGLTPGTYTGHVTVTAAGAQGSPATTTVTFTVNPLIPPSISYSVSPTPDSASWDNASVTVTFSCTAGTYPIQTCTAPVVVSTQGAGQTVTGTAVDTSGNSSSTTATVNIDETAPTITATITPSPTSGINYGSATVTFTCSDALSGIATCPSPVTDTTIGANQTISGTAVDKAGNAKSTSVTLNIQAAVPPTISYSLSPAPNASGWNNSSVTVTFTCTAGSYPIQSCTSPVTVSTQGSGQSVTGTAKDTNGLTATATVTVNLDTTAPTITASVSPAPVGGVNYGSVTVTFTCSDALSGIATCPSPVTVSTIGSGQITSGTATDKAGNSNSASVTLNIQAAVPPTISYSASPAPNANGWNNSSVTVTFTCTPGSYPIQSCPSPVVISTQGAGQAVTGTAKDTAGLTATTTDTVNLQTTPPTITATVSPAPINGINYGSATVSFACSDALSGVATCPNPVTVTTVGAGQIITGTVTDKAGNANSTSATVNIQPALPPTINATVSPTPNANGWNNSAVTVTFTCTAGSYPIKTCSSPVTVSTEGASQPVSGTVTDTAGQTLSVTATVSLDLTPPTISQFTAPTQLAPGQTGTAAVTASDNFTLSSVVIQLNGNVITTLTSAPYSASFTIPSTATSGATFTLTAVATDEAGNTATSSHGVQVVAAGVVVGQVLFDQTGLPFQGATVQIVGGSGQGITDQTGTYTIPSNASQLLLSVTSPANPATGTPAMIAVQRFAALQNGVGTVPVDARLTPVAAATSVGPAGGSLQSGSVSVSVAAGAVPSATDFHLTSLSQQGLPELLPLGWSPIRAFDLRADSSVGASFGATFSQLPNSVTLHLVAYNYGADTWTMTTPNLAANSGSLSVTLPSVGSYALVTADLGNTAIVIPSAGQALSGVAMVPLPAGSTASGSLNPPSISPTGGTSVATLAIQSSVPLPSGTVIQANVLETYNLASGARLSDPQRTEDLLIYQYGAPSGAAAVATFAVTPSQTFQPGQLSSGDVHLDILSGRESIRGAVGGNDPVVVTGGDATLTVSAGSLPQDTAIAVHPESTDSFLPTTPTLLPLAEYNLDFSGLTLNIPAQLSVAAGAANPGDKIFLAQIVRLAGAPYIVVVSQAQVTGTTMTTQTVPGLPGVTQGGDYIFYKVTQPTGFVSGTVSSSSGPITSLVQTDGLPFVVFTGTSGTYFVAALAGTVNITASAPNTALSGTVSVTVTVAQTATANITVVGQVETAAVTPANGSVGVPLTAEIDVTAKDAFNTATVTATSVTLTQTGQGANTPISLRFVFSQDNTKLAVFPLTALQPSTTYTFAASGLANVLGGLTFVPTITFTTQGVTAPNFNPSALVFAMPDPNGNVAISAPANSFPAGSTILIVDQTSGVVLSLTVANDGSVTGKMPATIDDVLAVTITAPDTTTTTFTISQFVAADGTTAIGPGGGTVSGPGDIGMIIPQGALNKGTTFKLALLDQTAFPTLPGWSSGTLNFGSGMQITAPAMPSFNKEVKLAFPVPANAPPGAFYYVFRRLMDANNSVLWETIDHAFVQGTGANAQVVTASPPFCGYMNSFGNFQSVANAGYQPLQTAVVVTFMLWDYDPNQAGVASPGLIVGNVYQNDASGNPGPLPAGATATISLGNPNVNTSSQTFSQYVTTTTGACGTYSLFDPELGGGQRTLTATASIPTYNAATRQTTTQKQQVVATTVEVNEIQPDDALFSVTAGLEAQYRNIGRLNFSFSPPTPPPPPPQIIIGVYTLDANNNRQPISGIVETGTSLTIAFASTLSIVGVTINGSTFSSLVADAPPPNPVANYLYTRLNDQYPAGTPGLYTIVASALDPNDPSTPITVSRSFLVVQSGGNNALATPGTAPSVIGTIPSPNAQSVSTSTFPEITFSEPVSNVPANVTMTGIAGDAPALLLLGVRADGSVANPVQSTDAITSLTIQPLTGLEFGDTYTLTLTNGILGIGKDQNGNPIPLLTYSLSFSTFGPGELCNPCGKSQYQVITRPVLIGQRAFAGEFITSVESALGIFDIANPSQPQDKGVGPPFIGRAIDAAGVAQSTLTRCFQPPAQTGQSCAQQVTGGPLVAISASPSEDVTIPGNVWLYDVSPAAQNPPLPPVRVGAVSVTSSATQAGVAVRLAIKDEFLYTSTSNQGLQVVDLQQALDQYGQTSAGDFGQQVTTDGSGFATEAVINTIPLPVSVPGASGVTASALMFGLQADDFDTSSSSATGATQTLLVATGQLPLVIADPTLNGTMAVVYPPAVAGVSPPTLSQQALAMPTANGSNLFCLGRALALGTISITDNGGNSTNKHIAVLVGGGVASAQTPSCANAPLVPVLLVVDVSAAYTPGQPFTPIALGFLQLPTTPTDITLEGSVALVATGTNVLLIDLENPAQPTPAGQITGTFGNWLGLADGGILVGTSPNSSNIGVQTAALGSYILVQQVTPGIAMVDDNGNTTEPITVTLEAHGQPADLTNSQIIYTEDGVQKAVIPAGNLQPGVRTVTIPSGFHVTSSAELVEVALVRPDGTQTPSTVLPLDSLSFVPSSSSSTSTSGQQSGSGQSGSGQSGSGPLAGVTVASLPASFDSVSPTMIQAGSGDTQVTIFGLAAGGATQVFVRGLDLQWHALTATPTTGTAAVFTIPANLLSQAGFLEVATAQDDASSIPLMIYNPALPAIGSGTAQLEADFATVDDVDSVAPDAITVIGANFVSGVTVVLGRGTTPGVALPTRLLDANTLQGSIPWPFAMNADDLFVAVMSADGTLLSPAIPLSRAFETTPASAGNQTLGDPAQPVATIAAGVDPVEVASANQFKPGEIGVTSVQGHLNMTVGTPLSQQLQSLYICGVNFVNGLLVDFRTRKGGSLMESTSPLYGVQTVATMPPADPTVAPQSPTALTCGNVSVPQQIPDTPVQNMQAKADHAPGTSANEQFRQPAVIPFGGRRQFGVYQDKGGNYRILTSLEASANANYQLANGPILSVSNFAPYNGNNTIQLERETANTPTPDTPSTAKIRATGLSVLPCDKIQKEVTTPPPCSTNMRALPQLQAALNGKVVATRPVESLFGTLGNGTKKSHPEYDATIAYYADMYGVPPHFLKAQAIQESFAYQSNFRFEFTSINLTRLAGDGRTARAFNGSQPLIQSSPFSLYLLGGNALRMYRPDPQAGPSDASQAQETQFFPYQDSSETQFGLGVSVKRTVGPALSTLDNCGRKECVPAVAAWIQDTTGSKPQNLAQLTLVHRDTIWQRNCLGPNGKHVPGKCGPTPPLIVPGVDNMSNGQNLLQAKEFAIDYNSGEITLGTPLAQGQQLKVTYWPVALTYNDNSGQPTVVQVNAGRLVNGAPDLNNRSIVTEMDKLHYNPGESLFDFLTNNVASDGAQKAFLTTVSALDNLIEFTVEGNNKPVGPRDPRYQFITSQPYASSSYGFLQLTLLPFGTGSQLSAAFDPTSSSTPIYQLLTQPGENFDLASHFHQITLSRNASLALCTSTSCNESLWEQEWTGIIVNYNQKGVGYIDGGIVKNGVAYYSPREPQ